MSSINTITHVSSFVISSGVSTLSKETIQRLLALGIDPTTVTSETQARFLIEQAEAAKKRENNDSEEQEGGKQQEKYKAELIQQNMFDKMDMISVSNRLILGL